MLSLEARQSFYANRWPMQRQGHFRSSPRSSRQLSKRRIASRNLSSWVVFHGCGHKPHLRKQGQPAGLTRPARGFPGDAGGSLAYALAACFRGLFPVHGLLLRGLIRIPSRAIPPGAACCYTVPGCLANVSANTSWLIPAGANKSRKPFAFRHNPLRPPHRPKRNPTAGLKSVRVTAK